MKFLGNRLDATTDARLTKAITSLSSVWPQEGGLTMNVHIDGSRKDLPLAPPFVVSSIHVGEVIAKSNTSRRSLEMDLLMFQNLLCWEGTA